MDPILKCSRCLQKNRIGATVIAANCGRCKAPFSPFDIGIAQAQANPPADPDEVDLDLDFDGEGEEFEGEDQP